MSSTEAPVTEALDQMIAAARELLKPGGTELQQKRLEALRSALRVAVGARAVQQLDQDLGETPEIAKPPR